MDTPLSIAPTVPSARLARGLAPWTYRNAELNELEYESVIRRSWQFACHVNQAKNPGDFVTLDLPRDSVLILRGKDGVLRAFMNVCRHRAAKLLDGSGQCKGRVTCPYHGWSYDLSGRLKAVPSEKTFPGLDKNEFGLREIELDILAGLVFVRIAGSGPRLAEIWGEVATRLEDYGIADMVPAGPTIVETWNCNWKTGVDNNLENYHVPIGHPGYHRLLDNELQGHLNAHGLAYSRSVVKARPSPMRSERFYQKLRPEALAHIPEPARSTWLFVTLAPNIGIDIYPDSMDIFQILPETATTCRVRYPIFRRAEESRAARLLRYLNLRINRQVSAEDRWLCERVQAGFDSHGYEAGPLSQYEQAVKDFHDRIRASCPVAGLDAPPESGSLRAANAAMLRDAA